MAIAVNTHTVDGGRIATISIDDGDLHMASCYVTDGYLSSFGVRKEYRRQGIARLMMQAALAAGARELYASPYVAWDETPSDIMAMPDLLRFYSSFGFRETGERGSPTCRHMRLS